MDTQLDEIWKGQRLFILMEVGVSNHKLRETHEIYNFYRLFNEFR